MRVVIVQGTRPEIIKNYSLAKAFRDCRIAHEVLHTGQHREPGMCSRIYGELGYRPDRTMDQPYTLGRAIEWLRQIFHRDGITAIVVNGDTSSALAGALAGMYSDIPVTHIEAGLRSRDEFMYEERNRIMVDSVATTLFAYTDHERQFLTQCPEIRGQVHCEGNTTVDVIHDFAREINLRPVRSQYVYVTMHRKEFTDSIQRMRNVFAILCSVARTKCQVVFPVHPRTRSALSHWGLSLDSLKPVTTIEPVTPLESLAFVKHATAVITDSGCLQEEAYLLKVPCVTIRDNTERHLTVTNGANVVTGFEKGAIIRGIEWALAIPVKSWPEIYGSAGVGLRIAKHLFPEN